MLLNCLEQLHVRVISVISGHITSFMLDEKLWHII